MSLMVVNVGLEEDEYFIEQHKALSKNINTLHRHIVFAAKPFRHLNTHIPTHIYIYFGIYMSSVVSTFDPLDISPRRYDPRHMTLDI